MPMDQPRIAFFDTKPYDREFFEQANRRYEFKITFFGPRLNAETVPLTAGFNTVCIFVNDTISADVAGQLAANGVKLIALRAAGYNNVDLKAVHGRIRTARVPEYSPFAVAEHTVALMLALNRKTHRAYYRTRDNNFSINGLMGFDMHGKTVGIIGTGKIGRQVIKVLSGFDMNILAYDPYPDYAAAEKLRFVYTSLDELYRSADIISLHCPLTPENVYLINSASIAAMKPGVMLINTGRGKLINTQALIEGLKTHKIGAAGLDVYEEETGYFFEDYSGMFLPDDVLARLLSFPNVLLTSHQAFFTREALANIAETTLANISSFFRGEKLANEICYHCGG
jgi:D-lactate dehydrogenase